MFSSMMLPTPGRIAAMAFMAMVFMVQVGLAQFGFASASAAPRQDGAAGQSQAEALRTGKERLGGKASDEQRVDNCKVPLELRGPTPRPDDCSDARNTAPGRR